MNHFNPVADILKAAGIDADIKDRRRPDYRTKTERVIDAIRDLRSVTAEEAKAIVTALEVRLATESQFPADAAIDALKFCCLCLIDIDMRDEAQKAKDYAGSVREMQDADRGL